MPERVKRKPDLPALPARPALPQARMDASRLVEAFLRGRNERTINAYRRDLDDFAAFLQEPDRDAAARRLFAGTGGEANTLVLSYRDHLVERKLSPATVNRRLAAVRSMVKLARVLGLVAWSIEIPGLKAQTYRDTAGPGREAYLSILEMLYASEDPLSVRNRVLMRLLHDLGLRRGEVASLRLEDVEMDQKRVWVRRKGKAQRVWKTLPDPVLEALRDWIGVRGPKAGTLLRNTKGGDLTEDGIYKIVTRLGERVGVKTRPHGFRHTAITEVAEAEGLLTAQAFGDHSDPRTTMRYIDASVDKAGRAAKAISPVVMKKGQKPMASEEEKPDGQG